MIRAILIFILLVLVYQSIKILVRSAIRSAQGNDDRSRLQGEDMVLDPVCRTYVLKDRAVTRNFPEEKKYFCSEECAQKYTAQIRD